MKCKNEMCKNEVRGFHVKKGFCTECMAFGGGMVQLTCKWCGKLFDISVIYAGRRQYCSEKCREDKKRAKRKKFPSYYKYKSKQKKRTCVLCNEDLPKNKHRYCTVKCRQRNSYLMECAERLKKSIEVTMEWDLDVLESGIHI